LSNRPLAETLLYTSHLRLKLRYNCQAKEINMNQSYIEQRDRGYWIEGTRVSLDSIVYRWLEGLSPETIADCFPVLTLEQVYGAITYYLSHRAEVDAYLRAAEQDYEAFRERVRAKYPRLSRRLDDLIHPAEATRQ
jgi:uncharacterized protein (DUF433 family)